MVKLCEMGWLKTKKVGHGLDRAAEKGRNTGRKTTVRSIPEHDFFFV